MEDEVTDLEADAQALTNQNVFQVDADTFNELALNKEQFTTFFSKSQALLLKLQDKKRKVKNVPSLTTAFKVCQESV